MRDLTQNAIYRGETVSVPFSVAFANNGALQIELIHQLDDGPSIYTEFLSAGREGMNQLAWWAPDFEATMAAAEAAGWTVVWRGTDAGTKYAYLEVPDENPAAIVEIMELNDQTRGMGMMVREAAADWDGSNPIRSFG
jgi:catechol 2,3-dioxygenase-like lactoylglutathione lyase family enzyme